MATSVIYRPAGRAGEYSHRALNLYEGCGHRCKYCYVARMPQWRDRDFFSFTPQVRADVIARLLKDAKQLEGTNERVLMCFSCDPYQPLEEESNIAGNVISILRQYDIPLQILTKGGMRAAKDFDLYGQHDAFATTLTFVNETKSRECEPFAATIGDRIKAIKLAKQKGIPTWVSLEPVINPAWALEIIRQTHPFVDHYKIGPLNHSPAGVIDWRLFGVKAIELLREYGKSYYIKDDLVKYLDGIHIENTDTRTVDRPARRPAQQGDLFDKEMP